MALCSNQTSLREALKLRPLDSGRYAVTFPQSTAFGNVTIGGLVISYAHKAASHFVSISNTFKAYPHVLCTSIQFFRPTLPDPVEGILDIQVANVAKELLTLHVKFSQNEKACVSGYFTMTNLSKQGSITADTGWTLTPAPIQVSIPNLEADCDTNWIGYLTPFSPSSARRVQSYVKFYVPFHPHNLHTIDQWVTPGWQDPGSEAGSVWTNDTIHFILDNCLPNLNDLIDERKTGSLHEKLVAAGLAQREARSQGKDTKIWGEGLDGSNVFPWIMSTISIGTEIKRRLPEEGTKWLFMRVTTKCILNGRMDYEIVMTDKEMNVVALSHQVAQIIPIGSKQGKKSVL